MKNKPDCLDHLQEFSLKVLL